MVVYFEVPNARIMLDELAIWDIIYFTSVRFASIALILVSPPSSNAPRGIMGQPTMQQVGGRL